MNQQEIDRLIDEAGALLKELKSRADYEQGVTTVRPRFLDDSAKCIESLTAATQTATAQARREALEEAAAIAEHFGPSRPIVTKHPTREIIGRWEGEQAASKNIAAEIHALAAQEQEGKV